MAKLAPSPLQRYGRGRSCRPPVRLPAPDAGDPRGRDGDLIAQLAGAAFAEIPAEERTYGSGRWSFGLQAGNGSEGALLNTKKR
jgi:hypothetical protein